MSAVHVGDRVLSVSSEGKPMFDKVFRITHHEPTEVTAFRRITLSSGDVLEITAEHLLHVGESPDPPTHTHSNLNCTFHWHPAAVCALCRHLAQAPPYSKSFTER
jgi:hypothetical protein